LTRSGLLAIVPSTNGLSARNGTPVVETDTVAFRGSWPLALWVGLLSLIQPGLGQIRAGTWSRGITIFAVNLTLVVSFRGLSRIMPDSPIILALYPVFIILSLAFNVGAAVVACRDIRRNGARARRRWFHSTWLAAPAFVAISFALMFVIPYGARLFNINGASNSPGLLDGDLVLVDQRHPEVVREVGDVMIFNVPGKIPPTKVDRVIALPGDLVRLQDGQLYINGQIVSREPAGESDSERPQSTTSGRRYFETLPSGRRYVIIKRTDAGAPNNTPDYLVPWDHVFVLGDNRDRSADSRFPDLIGYVSKENLIGKPVMIIWSSDPARNFTTVQ
jgi:signal peptidase I